jgi:hypothetical protein
MEPSGAGPPRSLDGPLARIDHAMKEGHGYTGTTLLSVLSVLQSWPTSNDMPVGVAAQGELAAYIRANATSPEEEIAPALVALTLRHEDITLTPLEPWEMARRPVRLLTRPIVDIGEGRVIIAPWFIGDSLAVYARYLTDGRLPWHSKFNHARLTRGLEDYRAERNLVLESDAGSEIKRLGYLVKQRIKKPKTIGLAELPGEIDVLAIDVNRGNLWVIEAKDPAEAFSVAEIERSVRRFYSSDPDEPGWVEKLLSKVAVVENHADDIAKAMGAPTRSKWLVRGLVVTRRLVPAAYFREPLVPFVTLDRCNAFLKSA